MCYNRGMTNTLKSQITQAIKAGLSVNGPGTGYGCGRAYVCLSKVDRTTLNAYKAAAKALGLRYLPEAYGAGSRALYIGYDNATGRQMAQANAIADNLRALGLPAYADGADD